MNTRDRLLDSLTGEVGPRERLLSDLAALELEAVRRIDVYRTATGSDEFSLERGRLVKLFESRLKALGVSRALWAKELK